MKRTLAACAVGLLAALAPSFAGAQGTFPTRTVRFIVPFPGGGINDVLARIVGEKLQTRWGQPIVIENKTGAGGNIGADLVAKAIREAAEAASVPVLNNPPLARALHKEVEIGQQIPEDFFQAVAEVLAFVYRAAGRRRAAA